jgi:MFS family permease
VGFKFNWALTVFYIVYIFVEIPSNILLKHIGPKFWIPLLVAAFGAVSIGTAFVKDFNGLMVARAVLGLVEGGTMPGISFFLSCFYKREELLFRMGIFISGSSMAGAFGGLLATGLSKIHPWGIHGELHAWRNIFFFEGMFTLLVGLCAPFFMPDRPDNCYFLTPRERIVAAERLAREHKGVRLSPSHPPLSKLRVLTVLCRTQTKKSP